MKRTLGTCYYPEHWPRAQWAEDARRMAELGLTWVRIGEFAWSRLEPYEGQYDWDWLDAAIDTLGDAGLKVVLGTPTATPPRWMLDKHPDMLAVDAMGHPRKFGSRRHYCFSHEGYARDCDRMVTALAERYGRQPHIAAWQTDNEYGCHDTVLSYSDAARAAFRDWLAKRYGTIEALNAAWGNVFWSMEYQSFDQIDLPNLTVTEPNPAHALEFRRFSSDQVIRFNARQVAILRAHSDAPLLHNYMGRVTEFDHFEIGESLDIATWDSYPLGFLEDRVGANAEWQRRYARQGDPDFQAFHHDLYRGVGRGRWWVMEQQPGPVNWAPTNPAPLPGMVRLWSWEAFAHGAEAVCYFRWRQAPFAQEQLHAGLLRPDSAAAPGYDEARAVAGELAEAPDVSAAQAPVALIFDYDADSAWAVQPHGQGLSYFALVFDWYRALRRLGLSVDVVSPDADLSGYGMIAAPGLVHMSEALKARLNETEAQVVMGPRSGARDGVMHIPDALPPAMASLDLRVTHLESLRADMPQKLHGDGQIVAYREHLEGSAETVLEDAQGLAVAKRAGHLTYLGAWLDQVGLMTLLEPICAKAGIATTILPGGLRRRYTGAETFWFNYDTEAQNHDGRSFAPLSVTRDHLPE